VLPRPHHATKVSDRSYELILRRELSCGLNILELISELPETFETRYTTFNSFKPSLCIP
jgi:hypothetical protein